jgi:hypothetical protein
MAEDTLPGRSFSGMDARRTAIFAALAVGAFTAWYLLLPWLQAWVLPESRGGDVGPWVIRPIAALHYCACAILTALSLAVLLRYFARRWRVQDAAAGSRYNPYRDRPFAKARILLASAVLAVVYGAALVYFLLSWTVVDAAGITERLPWRSRTHSYDEIRLLEIVSKHTRNHQSGLIGDGPWHRIEFQDGLSLVFGPDNEGCNEVEASKIAKYVAGRSKQIWHVRGDVVQR